MKNLIFKEGVHEKPIYGGELSKKGAWTVCTFKGWAWIVCTFKGEGGGGGGREKKKKKEGVVVFFEEWLIPQCTL